MRKVLLGMVAAGLLFGGPVSASESIDMAKVTCEQAVQEDPTALMIMVFWIDGYLSAQKNDTVITEKWMNELGEIVGKACESDPKKPLLDIVKANMQ